MNETQDQLIVFFDTLLHAGSSRSRIIKLFIPLVLLAGSNLIAAFIDDLMLRVRAGPAATHLPYKTRATAGRLANTLAAFALATCLMAAVVYAPSLLGGSDRPFINARRFFVLVWCGCALVLPSLWSYIFRRQPLDRWALKRARQKFILGVLLALVLASIPLG